MASIQKRHHSNGTITYRVRIRLAGMPIRSASFPTKYEAKIWAQKMEAEIRNGRHFPRKESRNRTFSELVDRYIQNELPKKPKSLIKQAKQLLWWKKHLGSYFLIHITPPMIAELRDKLTSEKTPKGNFRSSSTANRYLAVLSHAFNVCIKEWGWMEENPTFRIKRPKEGKACNRYLEKEEIQKLLEACQKSKSPYIHTIVLFALATGARKGEILNLKWQDINFSRGFVTFRDTKNGENRTIPLSKKLIHLLEREKLKRSIFSSYVFPSLDGTKPADIKTAWERAVKEAQLKSVRFHDLRHSAASYLAMGGSSTLEIAAILGHKTLAMVKRYSHLSTSSTAKAIDRLNDEIFGEQINA